MPETSGAPHQLAGPITTDLYHSENGDSWTLVHDARSGRTIVRHTANAASGGHVSETDVGTFFAQGHHGPEHAAARQAAAAAGAMTDTALAVSPAAV